MDYIIKKASMLNAEEKALRGIVGIPEDWPIEIYPYNGEVPTGFERISDIDFELLKANNQASYDAWLQALRPLPPVPAPQTVRLDIPVNLEGKPIFVRSMTDTNWHYSPHALDFYTSTYGSLYNRTEDGGTIAEGTDCGDALLRFFDAYNDELLMDAYESPEEFQVRLTASCVKTIVDFEKTVSYDIIGCTLYIESTPTETAYMWVTVAPDLPKEWGGNVSLMGRGMNLKMMGRPMYPHMFFAESVARMNYHPVYHSGKIRITVKHQAGQVIGIQNLFIMYEA